MINQTTLPPIIGVGAAIRMMRDEQDIQVIDVRTTEEFGTAHIPGSRNVPLDVLARNAREIATTITSPVILVCRSSARAYLAKELLREAGLKDLHVLDGGVLAWAAAGKELIRGRAA